MKRATGGDDGIEMPRFTNQQIEAMLRSVRHWYHRVEVAPGIVTPGLSDSDSNLAVLDALGLPRDCSGLRVLDLGARDGFFSFAMERRGAAEVVAVDYMPAERTGFGVLREIFDSRVRWFTDNVYDVTPEKYGTFDLVLCLGLLYHLRNPLLALDRVRDVCIRDLFIESHVLDRHVVADDGSVATLSEVAPHLADAPLAQFYGARQLNNDPTNWWAPTTTCLRRMLEATNFTVLAADTRGNRAAMRCAVNDDPEILRWRTLDRGVAP